MKKINIKPYTVELSTPKGKKAIPYDVVKSIENVVLASGQMTSQQLGMADLLRNDRVLEKVRAAREKGFVLLEEAEFTIIQQSFKAFKGFGLNEVELCKRIDQAEDVKVKEVKKEKGK